MSRPTSARSQRAQTDASGLAEDPPASPERATLPTTLAVHVTWLRTVLRRRFSHDLADDLAQEAYLRLTGADREAPVANPRGLLMTVAYNLARDRFRRERVRAEYAANAADCVAAFGGAHTAEDDLAVRNAILSLPAELRDVLLLSKIGGLTNREIAQRYSLSVRAIDKRLQRALTLFVARLRD